MIKRPCFSPSDVQKVVGFRLTPTGLVICGLMLWACGGKESTGPGQQPSPAQTVASVVVTPSTITLASLGETVQLTASASDASGNAIFGKTITWSSSDQQVVTVGSTGLATAVSDGTATVTATTDGVSGFASLTVVHTFTLIGHGNLARTVTSDVRVHGTVAYTGEFDFWGDGNNPVTNTLRVWDVSDPATPRLAASVVVDGAGSVPDVKIRADGAVGVITHQFSASGITLLDLSDPLSPQIFTRFTSGVLFDGVHNAWIEGDYVYAAGGARAGGKITIIDISNLADPQIVADFYAGSSGAHDVYVRDGLAFVSHWNAGLVILDVGNGMVGGSPTNPVEVGRVQPEGGKTHNAWYWPDAGYVFVGEESSRPGVVHVVDVSDLSNPVEVATFEVSGHTAHNFSMDEARGILYVTWLGGGLKAIDVSGDLVGRLDTQGREIGYTGQAMGTICPKANLCRPGTLSWGVQLHDGLVYVSDVNSGLWIFRPEF